MNWKILATTFVAMFLAELGDKTQIAVVTLAASTRRPLAVLIGAVAALALSCGLAVLLGEAVVRHIPHRKLEYVVGSTFVALGILVLTGRV